MMLNKVWQKGGAGILCAVGFHAAELSLANQHLTPDDALAIHLRIEKKARVLRPIEPSRP